MVARVYFRQNGAASTGFTDITSRIVYFDGHTPLIQMGMAYQHGAASQGALVADTQVKTTETYTLTPHMLIRWTEDAPGCEYWLAQGRMASADIGRGQRLDDANVEHWATVDDCNVDTRGLAFTEDWVRPSETDYARLVALQAYTLNSTNSTRPNSGGVITYRPSTHIVVNDTHLAPNTNTVTLPAKTYPAGTQPQEVIDDVASSAGKIAGVVIHHAPSGDTPEILIKSYNADSDGGDAINWAGVLSSQAGGAAGTSHYYFDAHSNPFRQQANAFNAGDQIHVTGYGRNECESLLLNFYNIASGTDAELGEAVISTVFMFTGSGDGGTDHGSTWTAFDSGLLTAPAGTKSWGFFKTSHLGCIGMDFDEIRVYQAVVSEDCSHLCLLYILESDHTTYASALKVSDQLADNDETNLTTPVCPPIWDQGRGRLVDGQGFVSGIVSRWGTSSISNQLSASTGDTYEYWVDSFYDSESTTAAQAATRAGAIRSYRSQYDESNRLSIILLPTQTHLITAGMSIQVKSAVTTDTYGNTGVYLNRRIVQLQWEPLADGRYHAIMSLNRGLRRSPPSVGKLATAGSVPDAGTAVPTYSPSGTVGTSQSYLPADSTLPMPPSTARTLTNKSGGAVVPNDVVILGAATDDSFIFNTTLGYSGGWMGIALEAIDNNATGKVLLSGYASKVNVGSNTATRGHYLFGSNMARRAYSAASRAVGAFGQVLTTSATPDAIIWSATDGAGGSGMATDTLWDAAGDLAVGTGADSATRLPIGGSNTHLVSDGVTASWVSNSFGTVDAISAQASGTGDVTTTASLQDLTGATLSLEAGTYIVHGTYDVLVNNASNDRTFEGHLDSGGSDQNDIAILVALGLVNDRVTVGQSWRLVLASTTTVKLRAQHSGGSAGDFTVKADNTTITAYRAGGGAMATDVLWDAKGDLAVGTGANTGAKHTVGADGTSLVADSAQSDGLKWTAVVPAIPAISNVANNYAGTGTSVVVTMTAPTAGDNLVCVVQSTGRGADSITQTNVTWTKRYSGNGNSQYLEVWTGVVSASAGTTATVAFTGSNKQQADTFVVGSGSGNFTAASAVSTATAATTALMTLSGGVTAGAWTLFAESANSPASAYSGLSQNNRPINPFGGAGRSAIMRAAGDSIAVWSLSSSAVSYFAALITLS